MKRILFSIAVAASMAVAAAAHEARPTVDHPAPMPIKERVEPEFFYRVFDTVQNGYTAWGRAKVYFDNGARWRDIVAANPFLQQQGRVWQDAATGRWYVLLFPGEVLQGPVTHVRTSFAREHERVPPLKKAVPTYRPFFVFWPSEPLLAIVAALLVVLLAYALKSWWTAKLSVQEPTDSEQHRQTMKALDIAAAHLEKSSSEKSRMSMSLSKDGFNFLVDYRIHDAKRSKSASQEEKAG